MYKTLRRLCCCALLLAGSSAVLAAAAEGAAPRAPAPRPGLFFEETWQQIPKGGENPISQAHVANPALELKTYGPRHEELQVTGIAPGTTPLQAKRELAGSFPLSTASNAAIVGQLGAIGFYDLPLDHLERFVEEVQGLSAEQVKAAMNRHLDPDAFVVVTVGPTVAQSELPPPTGSTQPQPAGVPH